MNTLPSFDKARGSIKIQLLVFMPILILIAVMQTIWSPAETDDPIAPTIPGAAPANQLGASFPNQLIVLESTNKSQPRTAYLWNSDLQILTLVSPQNKIPDGEALHAVQTYRYTRTNYPRAEYTLIPRIKPTNAAPITP
ncbi:MAG: hypothetical protein PHG25_01715 [Candidatus Pacebacteria bacterium]|nr:hypothetical protein [Candidatus Paceibacterota bacterium]